MANRDNQEVNYSFTGDVSSLQSAAEKALSILTQIEAKFKSTDAAGDFGTNKRATKSFQTNLKSLQTTVEGVQQKLQKLNATKLPTASVEALQFSKNVTDMQSALDQMDAKTKFATKDVKEMASALKGSNEAFKSSSDRLSDYVATEERFEQRLQRIQGLSEKVGNSIKGLGTNISSATDSVTSTIKNKLSTPFVAMTAVLQSFKDKSASALNHVKRMAEAAGAGFRVFRGDTEDAAEAHGKLASILERVKSAFKKETESVEDEEEELNKKDKQLDKSSGKHRSFSDVLKKVADTVKSEVGHIKSAASMLKKLTDSADITTKALKGLAKFATGAAVGKYLADATNSVADYIANLNLFNVAVGDANEEATSFVKTMANMYGLAPSGLYKSVGYFSELTTAIGATDKAASTMALSLTKASADLASLFNTDIASVQQNLAMGIEGQSRAVRKYGIDIQKATLQETAQKYGIEAKVSAMSEASRQALRYITIMDQIKDATQQEVRATDGATQAIGDFARTIESPANQLRVLKDQIKQLSTTVGSLLIPVLQRALPIINGFIMAIRTLLQVLATLLGVDMSSFGTSTSGAADSVEAIGDAAEGAADKMKKLIAPFDELNILSEDQDSGGGGSGFDDLVDPQLAALLDSMSLELDKIRMKAQDVRDAILAAFGIQLDEEGNFSIILGGFIDDLQNLWKDADYTGFGARIAEFINKGIDWAIEATAPEKLSPKLNQIVSTIAQVLNGLIGNLNAEGLGHTLTNLFNVALGMLYTWLTTFDFTKFGVKLGEGLNGIVHNANWDLLGKTLGAHFMSKINVLYGLFTTFDWPSLGAAFTTGLLALVNSIDFETITGTLVALVEGLIQAIIAAIPGIAETIGIIVTEIADAIVQYAPNILPAAGALLTQLVISITELLPTLVTAGLRIVQALAQAILDYIPTFLTVVPQLINSLVTTIIECIPDIIDTGVELISSLVADLPTIINNIVEGALSILDNLINTFIDNIPRIIDAGVRLLTSLITNLPQIIVTIVQAVPKIVTGITSALTDLIPAIILAGVQLLTSLIENLPEIIVTIVSAVPQIVAGIVEAFASLIGSVIDIGASLLKGIWQGITETASWLWEKVSGFFKGLIDDVKGLFGIHSPSTVFADIGDNLLAGLFNGLSNVGNKIKDWGTNILNGVKGVFGIHSPSKEMEDVGDYMMAGMFKGLEDTEKVRQMFQELLNQMTEYVQLFSKNVGQIFDQMQEDVRKRLELATNRNKNFTLQMVSMYQTMAQQSVAFINTIIAALNAIPRNITTIHTIITQSGTTQATGSVKKMATGGVVNRPTPALIGEGRYPEAVIPLGNSPQLEEMLDRIADKVNETGEQNQQPLEVHLYIGDKEWDKFTYESSQRGKKLTGAQPVQTGG